MLYYYYYYYYYYHHYYYLRRLFIYDYFFLILCTWDRGSTVVKVLCYKLEGRWFDPSSCHWNFSLT